MSVHYLYPPALAALWTRAAELLRRRQLIEETLRSGPTDPRLFDAADEGRRLLAEREKVDSELDRVQEQIKARASGRRARSA